MTINIVVPHYTIRNVPIYMVTHACTRTDTHARTHAHTHTHTALRQLMEAVTEAKKLEAENAHQWKQTKHLLKYIKNQEKEVGRNERYSVRRTVTH